MRTRRGGRIGPENFLTEFFAAALDNSPRFARDYLRLVIRDHASARGWRGPLQIKPGAVIVVNRHGSDKPDMQIRLHTGDGPKLIWCEHKWRSPLGPDQIVRYLRNPAADAVLYVRGDRKGFDVKRLEATPGLTVAQFATFVLPSRRRAYLKMTRNDGRDSSWGCFTWTDFKEIADQRRADPVVRWLHELWSTPVWASDAGTGARKSTRKRR